MSDDDLMMFHPGSLSSPACAALDESWYCSDPIPALLVEDEGDDISSISSDGADGEGVDPSKTDKPRSIFPSYWKTTPSSPLQRSASPKCVRSLPAIDPLEHFGLKQLPSQEEEEEEDSINTYERTLRQCETQMKHVVIRKPSRPYESRPLWMGWFTQSAPSLSRASFNGGFLFSSRPTHSESALHVRTCKSALRQGKFSGKKNYKQHQHRVGFDPTIRVHPFERPVESWAPDGWSNWFGSWRWILLFVATTLPLDSLATLIACSMLLYATGGYVNDRHTYQCIIL